MGEEPREPRPGRKLIWRWSATHSRHAGGQGFDGRGLCLCLQVNNTITLYVKYNWRVQSDTCAPLYSPHLSHLNILCHMPQTIERGRLKLSVYTSDFQINRKILYRLQNLPIRYISSAKIWHTILKQLITLPNWHLLIIPHVWEKIYFEVALWL